MAKDTIKMNGKVIEVIQSGNYKVQLENNAIISATISGKMRLHHIQILMGDKVQVELSPYDLTKGRIVYRE
ncbi:MAG: translation initiation factor IF-1 [Mycoplasmataceae bacterium]|jgi:translation initiation factor IF-1|nr:translation initiation factor IF-1 [Mycoplasmataceae bacterium]